MILYYDNLITDIPLVKGLYSEIDEIRNNSETYNEKDRLKIALYTLVSYSFIKWSNVIIRYELDEPSKRISFEKFVLQLFPNAKFIYGRSDNQKKFQEMAKLINSMDDEWIFYAGNNDHPFIAPNKKMLNTCLKKAIELKKTHKFVSIVYSHFPETINMTKAGMPNREAMYPDSVVLEEDDDCIVGLFPRGFLDSIQIINKNLLNQWLFSEDWGDTRITRIDLAHKFIKVNDQVVVIPKKRICDHYDGYSHTKNHGFPISSDTIPPLFIPKGFFNSDIKIAFGYDDFKEGWVNINPLKEDYIFKDKINGTDLKIGLEEIPLFWKKRISKVYINPELNEEAVKNSVEMNIYSYNNPFEKMNVLNTRFFHSKLKLRKILRTIIPKKAHSMLKRSKLLKKMDNNLIKYK